MRGCKGTCADIALFVEELTVPSKSIQVIVETIQTSKRIKISASCVNVGQTSGEEVAAQREEMDWPEFPAEEATESNGAPPTAPTIPLQPLPSTPSISQAVLPSFVQQSYRKQGRRNRGRARKKDASSQGTASWEYEWVQF